MLNEQHQALRATALEMGHQITGHAWHVKNDSSDRRGVFDAQDYLLVGVNRENSPHYDKENETGSERLHEYIAAFDPATTLELLRDLDAAQESMRDLEEHAADLEDEAKGWESWESIALEDLSMKHINRRIHVRKHSTDRLVGTLTHVSAGRQEGPFSDLNELHLTAAVNVVGTTVNVPLGNGDAVSLGPHIDQH